MLPASTSNAIQIVNPDSSGAQSPVQSKYSQIKRNTDQSQPRQCRNVLIFGHCKFEDRGCTFYHPPRPQDEQVVQDSSDGPPRVASPISIQHLSAPEFVPKAVRSPSESATETPAYAEQDLQSVSQRFEDFELGSPEDTFYHKTQPVFFPLDYHLYSKSAVPFPDISGTRHGFFIADDVREELQRQTDNIWGPPEPPIASPEEVHNYHTLVPLEIFTPERRKYFSHWDSSCYRAVSSIDGNVYALRRLENFRLAHESSLSSIELWRQLVHPNVVRVREAFTTRAFSDSSLIIAYDYHPLAVTLFDAFLRPRPSVLGVRARKSESSEPVEEDLLWSFIIQISNAMKAVHDRGLAFRIIDPSKILLTEKTRLRINCCGLGDLAMADSRDTQTHQQEDIQSFGLLMLSLCSRNINISNYPKTLDHITRTYSTDLKNAILFLMSPPGPHKVIGQIFDVIGSRLLLEMDALQLRADSLKAQLACEMENGRLVRLLSKFGFINERPEFARDFRWSETGDKYIVKLFRDHVFHSVDDTGRPVLSLTHVLTNLNKLDSGSDEKIMLVSRDEQSCLVVSYKEIKRCVEAAFRELLSGS